MQTIRNLAILLLVAVARGRARANLKPPRCLAQCGTCLQNCPRLGLFGLGTRKYLRRVLVSVAQT